MKTIYRGSLGAMLGLCLCLLSMAQDVAVTENEPIAEKKYSPFNVNLQVRNLYLWRGFKVSNSPITDVDMHYSTPNGSFTAGVWGGAGFVGDYKEFDYYVSYAKSGFSLSVWDINNFTDFPKADLFNYNKASTSHFIDVTAGYDFGKSIPLSINWSTIVQGRDTHLKSNGELTNSYSSYLALDYKLWKQENSDLHIFVGGAFALSGEKSLYSSKPNVVNAGLTLNKDLVLFKYHMPVSATAMFSPEHKHGAIQLVINAF